VRSARVLGEETSGLIFTNRRLLLENRTNERYFCRAIPADEPEHQQRLHEHHGGYCLLCLNIMIATGDPNLILHFSLLGVISYRHVLVGCVKRH
jgi:hypothetical protein